MLCFTNKKLFTGVLTRPIGYCFSYTRVSQQTSCKYEILRDEDFPTA